MVVRGHVVSELLVDVVDVTEVYVPSLHRTDRSGRDLHGKLAKDALEHMRKKAYYDYTNITLRLLRRLAQEWQQGLREDEGADMAVEAI